MYVLCIIIVCHPHHPIVLVIFAILIVISIIIRMKSLLMADFEIKAGITVEDWLVLTNRADIDEKEMVC